MYIHYVWCTLHGFGSRVLIYACMRTFVRFRYALKRGNAEVICNRLYVQRGESQLTWRGWKQGWADSGAGSVPFRTALGSVDRAATQKKIIPVSPISWGRYSGQLSVVLFMERPLSRPVAVIRSKTIATRLVLICFSPDELMGLLWIVLRIKLLGNNAVSKSVQLEIFNAAVGKNFLVQSLKFGQQGKKLERKVHQTLEYKGLIKRGWENVARRRFRVVCALRPSLPNTRNSGSIRDPPQSVLPISLPYRRVSRLEDVAPHLFPQRPKTWGRLSCLKDFSFRLLFFGSLRLRVD